MINALTRNEAFRMACTCGIHQHRAGNITGAGPDAARRHRRNAATTTRTAPASRRAAKHRCNACRRTWQASVPAASGEGREAPAARARVPAKTAAPATTAKPAERGTESCRRRKTEQAQISAIRSACRSDIQRFAPVCRPAARPHYGAWRRTRQALTGLRRRWRQPAAVARAGRGHRSGPRGRAGHRPRLCCGRHDRAKSFRAALGLWRRRPFDLRRMQPGGGRIVMPGNQCRLAVAGVP